MRAKKLCSRVDCVKTQPCPDHQRDPFAGSARDQGRRISGGRRQKRARHVLNRDDTICHVCQFPGATEVDHVIPLAHGGADNETNLAPIHSEPCHREKTAREARTGAGR